MKKYNQVAAIRGALRRAFSRSPVVREVLQSVRREVPKYNKDGSLAKKPSVQYQCAQCSEWEKSTRVSVDHITPVISESGFEDWNDFIARLFCTKDKLQPLCDKCHQKKTNAERLERSRKRDLEAIDSMRPFQPKKEAIKKLRKFTVKSKHPDVISVARGLIDWLKSQS